MGVDIFIFHVAKKSNLKKTRQKDWKLEKKY